ncbi:hypothetical protein BDA99DRAFT_571989 [Phascolomyces articulosus]|uniref:Uncharacterized protein n=1 Tax=Phascolomyces articulosus TaxID=60185 RepID=A0AAD5PE00_9FUNG|nr:hypothetical protein BDA99DRAFT_571989 [Phascolomyces articulosus]
MSSLARSGSKACDVVTNFVKSSISHNQLIWISFTKRLTMTLWIGFTQRVMLLTLCFICVMKKIDWDTFYTRAIEKVQLIVIVARQREFYASIHAKQNDKIMEMTEKELAEPGTHHQVPSKRLSLDKSINSNSKKPRITTSTAYDDLCQEASFNANWNDTNNHHSLETRRRPEIFVAVFEEANDNDKAIEAMDII